MKLRYAGTIEILGAEGDLKTKKAINYANIISSYINPEMKRFGDEDTLRFNAVILDDNDNIIYSYHKGLQSEPNK